MKIILVILCWNLSSVALASGVWIQGPQTSNQDFKTFVGQQPDARTYVQYLLSKLPEQDVSPSTLDWAQNILEQKSLPDSFFNELQEIEEKGMVDKSKRSFLISFLGKLKEEDPVDQSKIQKVLCKWTVFPGDSNNFENSCSSSVQDISVFAGKWPQASMLMIEDQEIVLKDTLKISVQDNEVYNWRILSNSAKAISFRGTLRDLRDQDFHFETIVRGNCDSFTHNLDDLELVSTASVYFGDACSKSFKEPETSRSLHWLEENRSWVIPVGVAVLGALAYQFKDKKLVIEKPSFR